MRTNLFNQEITSMLKQVFLSVLLMGPVCCVCQKIRAKDSAEITAKIMDWNKAWEVKDASLAAKWYSKNAEWTNAFGHRKTGKIEIEKFLTEVFSLSNVMSGVSSIKENAYIMITGEVVLVRTEIERKGQKINTGEEMETRNTIHHRIFKRINGQWFIVAHLIADARDLTAVKH